MLHNFASKGSWPKLQESKGPLVQVDFFHGSRQARPLCAHRADRCRRVA